MNLAPFAYIIIIIAGLKMANSLVVILLMAFFVFLIFLPLVKKLRSFGLSDAITTLVIATIIFFIMFIVGGFLVSSAQNFTQNLSSYQEKYNVLIPQAVTYLNHFGLELDATKLVDMLNPIGLIQNAMGFLKSMGNIMTNGILTLIIIMFLFLESSLMIQKIFLFFDSKEAKERVLLFTQSINTYFTIKTFTSLLTGLLIYVMLYFFHLEYALLFGFLAFILNYIPSIGSIIAAIPAIAIALLQLSLVDTFLIVVGYLFINNFISNFLEPKILSKGVGISTFFVFLSMVIWGWILGPIGMFLAVPLTITLKMASSYTEKYRWISVLLSDKIYENRLESK
jgi:predicted PurR-regulated permease PerM